MDAKTPRQTLKFSKNETPTGSSTQDKDYSPLFFPYSQDSCEEFDVMWDYRQSPKNHKKRVTQKRALFPQLQSPSHPIKISTCNKNDNFEKLKNELFALKESLACPDEIIFVSPQEEIEVKKDKTWGEDPNDLSNDYINDQLVQFTQQIENEMKEQVKEEPPLPKSSLDDSAYDLFDQIAGSLDFEAISGGSTRISPLREEPPPILSDEILNQIEQKRLEAIARRAKKATSQANDKLEHKVQFYSTKSFELNNKTELSQTQLNEAERGKNEALANINQQIEKNRLQAIERRESKKLQKIVEQKRQEALQRLRLRNAGNVKETLVERL